MIGALVGAALAAFRPYLFRLALAGGLAAAGALGFLSLKIHYTNLGYRQAINKIAADDKETTDAISEARDRVRACYAAGRVWDAAEGQCQG